MWARHILWASESLAHNIWRAHMTYLYMRHNHFYTRRSRIEIQRQCNVYLCNTPCNKSGCMCGFFCLFLWWLHKGDKKASYRIMCNTRCNTSATHLQHTLQHMFLFLSVRWYCKRDEDAIFLFRLVRIYGCICACVYAYISIHILYIYKHSQTSTCTRVYTCVYML